MVSQRVRRQKNSRLGESGALGDRRIVVLLSQESKETGEKSRRQENPSLGEPESKETGES